MKRKAYVLIKKAFAEAGIKLASPKIEVAGGDSSSTSAAAAQAMITSKTVAPAG